MHLSNKILSDPINKWLFTRFGEDIYLVGGYLRDLLLGGNIKIDKDYVLTQKLEEIALAASLNFKGTLIELKKDHMFRVALKDGQFLDFSKMQGTMSEDLRKRDFRINAMAWSPARGLIDPLNGQKDMMDRIIRVVNPENLRKDPLRILRAYRLSAQLGFTIDAYTLNYLREYAPKIKEAAQERITVELFKLLATKNAFQYISLMHDDNVLREIIHGSSSSIKHNIETLGKFDQFISGVQSDKFKKLFDSRMHPLLNLDIGQGLSRIGLIRLSILLNDLSSPDDIKISSLKCSNAIQKKIRNIHEGLKIGTGRMTGPRLYEIFGAAGDCVYEAAILVSVTRPGNVDKFIKRAEDFMNIKKKNLLDGYELQDILKIDPGALIGNIQDEIQKRRFLGITRTKREAQQWILSNFT